MPFLLHFTVLPPRSTARGLVRGVGFVVEADGFKTPVLAPWVSGRSSDSLTASGRRFAQALRQWFGGGTPRPPYYQEVTAEALAASEESTDEPCPFSFHVTRAALCRQSWASPVHQQLCDAVTQLAVDLCRWQPYAAEVAVREEGATLDGERQWAFQFSVSIRPPGSSWRDYHALLISQGVMSPDELAAAVLGTVWRLLEAMRAGQEVRKGSPRLPFLLARARTSVLE
jgi:hypothetical protein